MDRIRIWECVLRRRQMICSGGLEEPPIPTRHWLLSFPLHDQSHRRCWQISSSTGLERAPMNDPAAELVIALRLHNLLHFSSLHATESSNTSHGHVWLKFEGVPGRESELDSGTLFTTDTPRKRRRGSDHVWIAVKAWSDDDRHVWTLTRCEWVVGMWTKSNKERNQEWRQRLEECIWPWKCFFMDLSLSVCLSDCSLYGGVVECRLTDWVAVECGVRENKHISNLVRFCRLGRL